MDLLINFHYLPDRSVFVIDTDCFLRNRNVILICNIDLRQTEELNQKSDTQYPLVAASLGAADLVTWRHYTLGIVCCKLVRTL